MNITKFDEIIKCSDDSDVCDKTFLLYSQLNNAIDVNEMKKCEKLISLIWHSYGILGNGGFYNLLSENFKGDPSFRITANCYREIGVVECYDQFVELFNYFPNGIVSTDSKLNEKIIKSIGYDALSKIEKRFYSASGKIEKMLCLYIKANKDVIKDELNYSMS